MTSEFSSTKTLMNIDDDDRLLLDENKNSKGYFYYRIYI